MTFISKNILDSSFLNSIDNMTLEFFKNALSNAECNICGDQVFGVKDFIWWSADRNIFLCGECAEHTLGGLSRDLLEMKGLKGHPLPKSGSLSSPTYFQSEIKRLQIRINKYLKMIVDLQNTAARQNER